MTREERIKTLFVSILGRIANATDIMEIKDTDCGRLLLPVFGWCPSFEFTDEDIQLIKSLGEEMGEDFSILTES